MRPEHTFELQGLKAELFVISRDGSFDHARQNTIRLVVQDVDAGPGALKHIARHVRDNSTVLPPFELTHTAAHGVMLAMEAGHSNRYERDQLVARAIDHCQQIVDVLDQALVHGIESAERKQIEAPASASPSW